MPDSIFNQRDPKVLAKGEIPSESLMFREFAGMNTSSPRESIADEQFFWLENVIPIGAGNLTAIPDTGPPLTNVTPDGAPWKNAAPVFAKRVSFNSTDYAVELIPGAGVLLINMTNGATQVIAADGVMHVGMDVTSWQNRGFLLVDPINGYYDWNITANNALTHITGTSGSGTVSSVTVTSQGAGYTSLPTVTFSGGGATTQATGHALLGNVSLALITGGLGYAAGDVVAVQAGSAVVPLLVQVNTVDANGGILAYIVVSTGIYSAINAAPYPVQGGTGAGAQFASVWGVNLVMVDSGGAGYTSAPTVGFAGGGSGAAATAVLNGAGASQVGTSIVDFAGRAWIGNGRSVAFTDVDSYNSFGGAGGSFILSDSTSHGVITALFSANGYLYLFTDASIDLLSNVQVSSGVTTFSRINLTSSVGTAFKTSLISFQRAVVFANANGVYVLEGTSPSKISRDLDGLLPLIDLNRGIYGYLVTVDGLLCLGFSFFFLDQFTSRYKGQYRPISTLFFNNRWYAYSPTDHTSHVIVSSPVNSLWSGYILNTSGLFSKIMAGTTTPLSIMSTKLWDLGSPILDKSLVQVGVAGSFPSGASITCDMITENGSFNVPLQMGNVIGWVNNSNQSVQWQNNALQIVKWSNVLIGTYIFLQSAGQVSRSKYVGMDITGNNLCVYQAFAFEYKFAARW